MDPSVWLPWAWSAGAVACGIALWWLHPFRAQVRLARRTWQTNGSLWLVPVLMTAAEMIWKGGPVETGAGSLVEGAARHTGESLAGILTWTTRGDILAMILAAAFLADSGGLRRGLWKGMETVFSPCWRRALRLAVLASATFALGMPAVRFGAGGESGRLAVSLLASLWSATAATLFMCWITLHFTAGREPAKFRKARRLELAGQLTARLWQLVLAGAVTFPIIDAAGPEWRMVLPFFAWPLAGLLAWFPLTALQSSSPDAGDIHTLAGGALRRWASGLLPFTGWLAFAGTFLFAFHLAAGWGLSLCPDGSVWRIPARVFTTAAEAWLAVWMLGAWIVIQMDNLPVAIKDARPSRREALA